MTDSTEPHQLPFEQVQVKFTRHENFESWYSNNVQFVPTDWDLRMVFGEVDLPNLFIQQHTAMTVSWLQAKLMHYFLTVNLGIYEISHGKIKVPDATLPPEPQPPTGEFANDPAALEVYEYLKTMRQQFVESLK